MLGNHGSPLGSLHGGSRDLRLQLAGFRNHKVTIQLDDALAALRGRSKEKLAHTPKVVVEDGSFDVGKLPIGAEWNRLADVVAGVCCTVG